MKIRQLGYLMLLASLVTPSARAWADYDKKESATDEKTESREHQLAEEHEAMEHYNKKVAKFGKDSAQAKKAWKNVVAEYKEHGDTPPAPEAVPAPSETK
jgi:hypothetical protein